MRKIIVFFIIVVISNSCMSQNRTINLQQIEFKDKMLERIFTHVTKSDCFNKNDFYVVDFFKSGISNNKYYLSIDRLMFDNNTLDSIAYYLVINNIVFFVPETIPDKFLNVLPLQKEFTCKQEEPYPSGDYNFLIYGTLNGYYKIIYNTCAE